LDGIFEGGNLRWFRFSLLLLEIVDAFQKKSVTKRYHSELARRFREDLILDGKEPKSVKSYLAAVAHLAEHYRCSPERLSEDQIRQYLLLRSQSLKKNSMRPILAGIQFFYRVTVPRDWKTLAATRIPRSRTLPAVLMPQQVWRLIDATRAFHFQVFFRTSYTCGLRPGDTRYLTPDDVDSDRMLLQVRTTKGRNDRDQPFGRCPSAAAGNPGSPARVLEDASQPEVAVPARADLKNMATATKPISERSVQRAFAQVVQSVGLKKKGLCPHTLRHFYATAMLEAGVNLKVLQSYLGHKNLQATEVYLHLRQHSDQKVLSILFRNKLRDRLRGTKCFAAIPSAVWQRDWTVDSIAVGDGRATLKYLAPYVMRGPVSNWRVTHCNQADSLDNARLTLQVKRSGTSRYRGLPLTVTEFIRRWLLHVLPAGLHRVRYYGFLNGSSKRSLEEVRWLVAAANRMLHYLAHSQQVETARRPKMVCPKCGGAMICLGYTPPALDTCAATTATSTRAPP